MNHFVMTDPKHCIGCHACEIACVMTHYNGEYPELNDHFLPRIKVIKNDKTYTALTCRHCENAPCIKVCPTAALVQDKNSIQLLKEKCIGCKACVLACPFGAVSMVNDVEADSPSFHNMTAHKCDLCSERADSPACAAACPTKALKLYRANDLVQQQLQKQQRSALTANGKPLHPALIPRQPVTPLQRVHNNPRIDAKKIALEIRKQEFVEIYQRFTQQQVKTQADRCLSCGQHSVCEWTCPLHNRIPHWLKLAKEGKILEAAELCHQTNSLPEVCGRVCPQERLCEGACTLNNEHDAVTIGNIERYITETAFELGWRPDLSHVQSTGKQVAIIGAGPAGLACADILIRNGIQPVVFDRHPAIGGMLTFGIPSFKLEKDVMLRRHELFSQMGIEFRLNTEVGIDISFDQIMAEFDAIFVGVGTYRSMRAGLENENAKGVYDALPFLTANTKNIMGLAELANERYISMKGKRVVVLGGGDTAMDCLRTAVRQGAASITCAYRRDEKNMPGSKKEVKNAREEGVEFMFNLQPIKIEVTDDRKVMGIKMLKTQLGTADAAGRRRPEPIENSEFTLEADAVIMAFGFKPHTMAWLEEYGVGLDNYGTIIAPPLKGTTYPCQTSNAKIFAGGDVVRGADLVVTAIADGRKAATSIISYLGLTTQTLEVTSS